MTISAKLKKFYLDNNLPENGGTEEDYFNLKFRFFSLKIPNYEFRKNVLYIHDIQHILYDCDITWKGEAFIAGWEIATGFWKHLPIGFASIWAMGVSLLLHPKEVVNGYKAGLQVTGLIDLKIDKEQLLSYTVKEVETLLRRDTVLSFNPYIFVMWILISLFIVFSPLIVGLLLVFL
ncbi:hypothetical protein ACQY1Q_07550 [Tenacibaculum sp. TC6]|uniref:hypothetical protein n=1 Tax=Tenacibaculum sp. TC6 TaxID=3423223 RepID=UPI003D35AF14